MTEEHWLDAGVLACTHCGFKMSWVDRSPFHDDHKLYCDRCPRAVEIGYYSPQYRKAMESLPAERTWELVMQTIEPLLKSCVCEGRFRASAPGRCFSCGTVAEEAAGKDLSPYIGCEDEDRDPTEEEQAKYDRFESEFIIQKDIWVE